MAIVVPNTAVNYNTKNLTDLLLSSKSLNFIEKRLNKWSGIPSIFKESN